jgi:Ni,Fe-hydrogenase III small subunit
MWFDSYATVGGLEKVLPVNYFIPGCPPRPEAILYGVAVALGIAPKKVSPIVKRQESPDEIISRIEQGA